MAKRFLIILVICCQALLLPDQTVCLVTKSAAWAQTCFVTGENTFSSPLSTSDGSSQDRPVLPGDIDLQDMPENDEDDAFRHHLEAKVSGASWGYSRSAFADYCQAPCASVSRDIHKPPPERLS